MDKQAKAGAGKQAKASTSKHGYMVALAIEHEGAKSTWVAKRVVGASLRKAAKAARAAFRASKTPGQVTGVLALIREDAGTLPA